MSPSSLMRVQCRYIVRVIIAHCTPPSMGVIVKSVIDISAQGAGAAIFRLYFECGDPNISDSKLMDRFNHSRLPTQDLLGASSCRNRLICCRGDLLSLVTCDHHKSETPTTQQVCQQPANGHGYPLLVPCSPSPSY